MNCPACKGHSTGVVDSRCFDGETITRRRSCGNCRARWTTDEYVREGTLTIAAAPLQSCAAAASSVGIKPPLNIATNCGPTQLVVVSSVGAKGVSSPPLHPPSSSPNSVSLRETAGAASGARAAAKGKAKKATKARHPLSADFMGWFRAGWQAIYRVTWVPEGAIRDNVDAMLFEWEGANEAVLKDALKRFFADKDQFLVKNRHALRHFVSNPNRHRVADVKPASYSAPTLCEFHTDYRNDGKPARWSKPGTCSECKHVAARKGTREGDPTTLGDLLGNT